MVCNGSLAAKVALLERMAAFSQKAELNQACLSVLFCSGFGQKERFLFLEVIVYCPLALGSLNK
jgi:hypothetical protein